MSNRIRVRPRVDTPLETKIPETDRKWFHAMETKEQRTKLVEATSEGKHGSDDHLTNFMWGAARTDCRWFADVGREHRGTQSSAGPLRQHRAFQTLLIPFLS